MYVCMYVCMYVYTYTCKCISYHNIKNANDSIIVMIVITPINKSNGNNSCNLLRRRRIHNHDIYSRLQQVETWM